VRTLHAAGCTLLVMACGSGSASRSPADDAGSDAARDVGVADVSRDVPADAPRVLCPDSAPDGGPSLCGPGMICGNSGGVPGNFCCYPTPGSPGYCPPP
jgi:hypothetical protein